MDPPSHCPEDIWEIISDCWRTDPEDRPSATRLYEQLDEAKVAMCSAPDGQYYGVHDDYGQAGTVKGPSLEEILQTRENLGFEDEEIAKCVSADTDEAEVVEDSKPVLNNGRIVETADL